MGIPDPPLSDLVPDKGPRARMRAALLEAALDFTGRGLLPSVSEVAEAAQVSRATAYRYFPSQAALVQAVVAEALGPILNWNSNNADAEARVAALLAFAYPRMEQFEAPLRAGLRVALEQWARRRAGTLGDEPLIVRGNRIRLLQLALAPLKGRVPRKTLNRLVQALALTYGTETMIVLKDIFNLNGTEMVEVVEWTARALVRAAVAETQRRTSASREAAARNGQRKGKTDAKGKPAGRVGPRKGR